MLDRAVFNIWDANIMKMTLFHSQLMKESYRNMKVASSVKFNIHFKVTFLILKLNHISCSNFRKTEFIKTPQTELFCLFPLPLEMKGMEVMACNANKRINLQGQRELEDNSRVKDGDTFLKIKKQVRIIKLAELNEDEIQTCKGEF